MERYARHYINGKDVWWSFGVVVESGSDDFLKFPERKDSTEHNWSDANGIDKDLNNPFFKEKKISLKCAMIADYEEQFWKFHDRFIAEWAQPGVHIFTVAEFSRQFRVYYENCSEFERFTRIQGGNKVACRFTLNLVEIDPGLDSSAVHLVDEEGRFIVT